LGVGAQQNGKLYGTALLLHQVALETTQAVLKDCNSKERPNLLLSMVKGYNHAASCALQLDLHRKARDHAKNAIAVLDALEKKGQTQQHLQLLANGLSSPSSVTSVSSTSSFTTSSEDSAAVVGKVKLFGECRCKALIFVARSYLEYPKCKQRHCDLAKNNLDKASAVIKKYTTKEYTGIAEMKPVLKQFVGHKRNITKYRQVARQPMTTSPSTAATATVGKDDDSKSYSTWFANKRVWFADDAAKQLQESKATDNADKAKTRSAVWTQAAASAVAYTGFVALGAFVVHQMVMSSRRK
jgi:hypothetical protein